MADLFKPASPKEIANRQPYLIDTPIYPLKPLPALAEVVSGVKVPSNQILNAGIWHLIQKQDIVKGAVLPGDVFVSADFVKKHPQGIIIPGDILVPPSFEKYEVTAVPGNVSPSFIGSGIVRIRPSKYLISFLRTEFGKSTFEQLLWSIRGSKDIRKLKIPVLSSDILKVLGVDVSQKSILAELQNAYSVCEKEISRAIISMLVQKGWSKGDIETKSRISEDLSVDILLKRKGKPVALVEIKNDTRNTECYIPQIKLKCKAANIRFGYLISESRITEISCLEDKLIERKYFPSPEELK